MYTVKSHAQLTEYFAPPSVDVTWKLIILSLFVFQAIQNNLAECMPSSLVHTMLGSGIISDKIILYFDKAMQQPKRLTELLIDILVRLTEL